VYILAVLSESINGELETDLKINMWVIVEDTCWNRATTLVEFWIAPTVESAASIGRQCDEPDYTPVEVGQGSFTSRSVIRGFTLSHQDRLPIEKVTSAALLSNGLILGAIGNAQSLFRDEDFNQDDWLRNGGQRYIGRITVRITLTPWSVDLANILTICRKEQVSSSILDISKFSFSSCAPLRGRQNRGLTVQLNFGGQTSEKSTRMYIQCRDRSSTSCISMLPVDVRDYFDDVRRDANGNLVSANQHQFLQLSDVVIQNAGLSPVGVRAIRLNFDLGSASSTDSYDWGIDAPPSWTLPLDSNLRKNTLIHDCNLGDIDWCSFDFYYSSLTPSDRDLWVQRQHGADENPQVMTEFRNYLTVYGLDDFRFIAPPPIVPRRL